MKKLMRRYLREGRRKLGVASLLFLTVFYSFGGIDLYLGLTTPFAPRDAKAAYTGVRIKTVEYVLGGGSDAPAAAQASAAFLYAGSSWNATRATAGTSTVTILGSGIRARSAYLDVWFQTASVVDLDDIDVTFAASAGDAPGVDVRVGLPLQSSGTVGNYIDNSGTLPAFASHADVTGILNRVTDSEWNAGIGVVAGLTVLGPTWSIASIRLVITYEEDYSTIAHNEVKTVRFPLSSTTAGDTGTKRAICAAAATCPFTYRAELPDLAAGTDIYSVWFELRGMNTGTVVPTITPTIAGGTVGPTFSSREIIAGVNDFLVLFSPAIGAPNFVANATGTLNILVGGTAENTLGGELVITYKYSTGAARQTETVTYFMLQQSTNSGVTKTAFSQPVSIANGGRDVRNLWYRVRTPHSAALTFTVYGTVGAATEKSNAYTLSGTGSRSGETFAYYNMSADRSSFSSATTTVAGAILWSSATGASEASVELAVTFVWDGSLGGAETKSTSYYAGADQGSANIANEYHNTSGIIFTPETVTKLYRSGFMRTAFTHSDATAIILSNITMVINGTSTKVVTEEGDLEAFTTTYLQPMSADGFTGGTGVNIENRITPLNLQRSMNNAEEQYFSNVFVLTYEVNFAENAPTLPSTQLKTVEFVLGGGSDATALARTTGTFIFGGASWNIDRTTAGTSTVMIKGSGIRVRSAYLDSRFQLATAVILTDVDMTIATDVGDAPGVDVRVGRVLQGAGVFNDNSGVLPSFSARADVSGVLNRVSSAEWNTGIGVVTGLSATGPSWSLASTRLVITYEEEVSLAAHDAVKTVRFPLSSTAVGDTGTKQAVCAASTICSFEYRAELPDLQSVSDIYSVWFDLHGTNTGTVNPTLVPQVSGGTVGPTFSSNDVVAGVNDFDIFFSPLIGAPDFVANATGTLDIVNGLVAQNTLGGELVITYKYSTGASRQTETVYYYMLQQPLSSGITKTVFAQPISIANGGRDVRNLWYKVRTPHYAALTLNIFGTVGAAAEKSNAYVLSGTGTRAGETVAIYDMSADRSDFSSATTTVAGAIQWSSATGAASAAVELAVTFVWEGNKAGPQTKSTSFLASADQATSDVASEYHNTSGIIFTPESETKLYRSGFMRTTLGHSQATAILLATITMQMNGTSTITVTEEGDTEAFTSTYLQPLTGDGFTGNGSDNINFSYTPFNLSRFINQANEAYFSNEFSLTYEVDFPFVPPTFTQNYFRFYQDNDALTPTVAWPSGVGNLGENAEITAADNPPANGDRIRLRMSLRVATTTMTASSTQFNLQFAEKVTSCGAVASWTDLGAPASGALWRGFNATPVSGVQLAGGDPPPVGKVLLSVSDSAGTYQESNPTAVNPFAVIVGNDVEYDWNIQSNNAATNTPYCFRMTKSDGSALFSYDFYPVITTRGFMPEEKKWHWYDDETSANPTVSLSGAGEIVAPSNVANGNTIKLRLTINETNASMGPNQKFRLQFSTYSDFSANVNFVESTSTCVAMSQWCYGDGVDTNNDPITARVLSDSTANGTHNESATNTTTFYAPASTATEYEFTIIGRRAYFNTTYFFRVYDVNHNRPVPLAALASYPSLSVEGTTLSFSISGLATSTVTEGVTTDVGTTPTQTSFMTITPGTGKTAAQQLSVTTNAENGYQVFLGTDGWFTASVGHIPDAESTNAVPLDWATACPGTLSGCFGYHAGDDTLGAGSTRFLLNDTYAPFASTTLEEVMYNSGPVTADVANVVYRLDVRNAQPAGSYSVRLIYLVVPTF